MIKKVQGYSGGSCGEWLETEKTNGVLFYGITESLSLSPSLPLSLSLYVDGSRPIYKFPTLPVSIRFYYFYYIFFHDFLELEYSHFFSFMRIDWQAKISLFKAAPY